MTMIASPSRQEFLVRRTLGGLVLVASVSDLVRPKKYGADGAPRLGDNPLIFVAIGGDKEQSRSSCIGEMGQVRTGMPLIVAMNSRRLIECVTQAPADEEKYGNQDTDGSGAHAIFEPMRRCAGGRTMLEQAAAHVVLSLKCAPPITQSSTRQTDESWITARWRNAKLRCLRAIPFASSRRHNFSTSAGKPHWPMDGTSRPESSVRNHSVADGMLFAVIARSPALGGKIASVDSTAAERIPGVVKVMRLQANAPKATFQPLAGVGVIANDTWVAIKGRNALKIQWDEGPNGSYDSSSYRAELEHAARQPGKVLRSSGDFDGALSKASRKIQAEYYLPRAHARWSRRRHSLVSSTPL